MTKQFWQRTILMALLTAAGMLIPTGMNRLCAQQQNVIFTARVDRKTIPLDSQAQLMLTVTGAQAVSPIKLPIIDGFDVRYLGPATRVSIVNGVQSSSVSFMYNLYPTKTGRFEIPAFAITVDGQMYTSEPISVEVVEASSISGQGMAQGTAQSLAEKVFIVMGIPKAEVYLYERIPLTIKLYINHLQVKDIQYPEFGHESFSVDEYAEPQQYEQVIGGVAYRVVEFDTYVYPTREGKLALGPAKLSCNLLIKSSSSKRGAAFERLFDDELFDGIFGTYEVRPITAESADLAVTVTPLPAVGRPADFSGAVGRFHFDMTASPDQLKVGDPITIRMTITGDGNLKTVNMPDIKNFLKDKTAFKLYDPIVSEKDGKKILEQVLIPAHERITEIPAVTFSYFDPEQTKYVTVTRGPFPISIKPLAPGEGLRVVGLKEPSASHLSAGETLGEDIGFIKERPGTWHRKDAWVYRRPLFWILAAFVAAVWGFLWFFFRFTDRIRTDERFARRMLAPAKARKGLKRMEELLNQGKPKEFYDALFKTLQEYFGNKLHLPAGSVNVAEVEKHLQGKNIDGNALEQLKEVLAECDRIRFGSLAPDPAKMREHDRMVRRIIDDLERKG